MSQKGYLVRELDQEHKLKRLLERENKISYSYKPPVRMQASSDHPPRLSSALRAYGRVSDPLSSEPVSLEERVLRRKQRKKGGELLASEKTWQQVISDVVASCTLKQDETKVRGELRLIQQEAREIVGGDFSQGTVDSAAIFLFDLFSAETKMTRSHAEEIRRTLGPYPASTVNRICKTVEKILRYLPDGWGQSADTVENSQGTKKRKEFGHNIQFKYSDGFLDMPSSAKSVDFDLSGYDSLSDSEEVPVKSKLVDFVASTLQSNSTLVMAKRATAAAESANLVSAGSLLDHTPHSSEWLVEQCKECLREGQFAGELSWQDLYQAVFEHLSSPRDSMVIQNDLAELLGLTKLDLIQELLTHRQSIVSSMLENSDRLLSSSSSDPYAQHPRGSKSSSTRSASSRQPSRPTISSQVVIQSEQEKQLMKIHRKEDRRLARQQAKGEGPQQNEADPLMDFDPEYLRRLREVELELASNRPLFTGTPMRTADPNDLYPHVYDSMAKAKLSSAILDGKTLGLPEEAKRTNDRTMEEITIPATATPPPPVGEDPVRISNLDKITQVAFKGVKTLNRIQSIVFDAAYNTSENLLISAPTGAGKTNIAMLTVLREIRRNMEDGVIHKDKFKIIYVAPMKALAAEMVANFGGRLAPLGITVRELTGDMQLTKKEVMNTQMIVTTPEKWDVVTRKATGDVQLSQIVRLLIIDEVHLLHENRGAVIESLVARTLRQVESSQTMIRIVGLSATLPNYLDVAKFLRVNFKKGLFFFDGRFRPVPLTQTFIGVKTTNRLQLFRDMDEVCYDKVLENVRQGHQVMVFVHARNATVRTAEALRDLARSNNHQGHFAPEQTPLFGLADKQVQRSRNKQLRDLFGDGFSIHHAGMLRQDRSLVERLFSEGLIKVLVCTATLAWGVNLPAHAVIIKGTEIYDAKRGAYVDLGILDVLQIFGRAGRPQYDTYGHGVIITAHSKLAHYLSLLTRQQPIESQLTVGLTDNLNAEIALGTVTTVDEAVQWLSYTYLHIRMLLNPQAYGISFKRREEDPYLELHQRELIVAAATQLDKARMIRYHEPTGTFHSTDLGRTASHFYIKHITIETFNELMSSHMHEGSILAMVSKSQEFEQLKVREDEMTEMDDLMSLCRVPVQGGVENTYGKVNVLLQTYISCSPVESFSLTSDLAYVAQNAGRILRGLFEIALRKGQPSLSSKLLTLCKCVDHRRWMFDHPLKQFSYDRLEQALTRLEEKKMTLERLRDMTADEIGHMIHHVKLGQNILKLVRGFPSVSLSATIQPITRTVLRVRLTITPEFEWDDRQHGMTSEPWWVWVEDAENDHMYHSEYFLLQRKQVKEREQQDLVFTIPIFEPLPPQYYVRVTSDRWLGAESVVAISFQHLILPELHPPHTKLLNLQPLPVSALQNSAYEELFRFEYFNPVQSQVFHTLYHSDTNVLVGAPTGSGKTVAAELAIFRVFNHYPGGKAVYIAPLKALVRERIDDWKVRLEGKLGKRVVELTGDTSPDIRAIERADVIVTTPEKWDGISRSWQNRTYVQAMRVLIIDEIHLLGDERGPVLEVIVSRTNFISSHTQHKVRVVGLSTALANARDLADWLGIKQEGLFNFHPAVRPVQLEIHIDGFPGKHYCPRMATMNKPAYIAIQTYSPSKPVLIFVSSRRQTRLTAFDLVAFVAAGDVPKQWLHMPETEMESLVSAIRDQNLKFTLSFGIGLHHAGLHEHDRRTVEQLFVNQKIQVLIATSTLAWGVNFPAHLVVVKGTEYYDGKMSRYVDYPITDVLQMMGRAGRPQYDDRGVAVILVHDIKKHFYKKFLYEPFPVESNLRAVLADHMNAEIVAGTITSKQDAMDYVTWTYFFRRLLMNPSYYQLEVATKDSVNKFLSQLVSGALAELEGSYCIEFEEDDRTLHPLTLGCIASYYYLHHGTVRLFKEKLHPNSTHQDLLQLLCDASEYNELPVRHNEDSMNRSLAELLPLPVSPPDSYESPHTKTHLLLQAHFSHAPLPIADYATDTKSVLDQALRILQALVDISSNEGWLGVALKVMQLIQMCVQGRWLSNSSLLTLPHFDESVVAALNSALGGVRKQLSWQSGLKELATLPELMVACEHDRNFLNFALKGSLSRENISQVDHVVRKLPIVTMRVGVSVEDSDDPSRKVTTASSNPRERKWIDLPLDSDCLLQVELKRRTFDRAKSDSRVHAPRFPKAKDEGWWLVLGEVDSKELLAVKRLGFIRGRTRTSLAFSSPDEPCHQIYSLYLVSDCYLGLDQQVEMCFNFTTSDVKE